MTLASAALAWMLGERRLAEALGFSFLCSVVGLVLTVVKQLPVNARLRDAAAEDELLRLREQTVHNFTVRFVFAVLAFAVPCAAVVFLL